VRCRLGVGVTDAVKNRYINGFQLAVALTSSCAPTGPRTTLAPASPPASARPAPPSATASAVPTALDPAPTRATAAPSSKAPAPGSDEIPPLPPGFIRTADADQTPCGGFSIEHFPDEEDINLRFVRVFRADGTKHYEARGRTMVAGGGERLKSDLFAEFCGDLTLDGIPEVALTEKSVGAHCCYTHYLVSLTSPPKRIMFWEKGDAGTPIVPVRYRSDGPFQLEGRIVFFPAFDPEKGEPGIPYAGAPLVPAVLSLVGGEYRLTSFSFPEAYRRDRQKRRASCQNPAFGCDNEFAEWIDALIIGDWDTEKSTLDDLELKQTLERHAAVTRKQLFKTLGSVERPARTR